MMSDQARVRTAMNALSKAMRVLQESDSTALTEMGCTLGGCYGTLDAVYFGDDQVTEGDGHVDTVDAWQ